MKRSRFSEEQIIGILKAHQPFRRREGAMAKFRDVKTLQKFTAVHASIHNHFNQDCHLSRRDIFKQNRSTVLAEWRQLAAYKLLTSTSACRS